MKSKNMWMVRAGKGGVIFDVCRSKSLVAIGWDIGDLSQISSREDIRRLIKRKYPGSKAANQVIKFRFDFKKGDNAITYNTKERVYLVGKILSNYEYNESEELEKHFHIRKVEWLWEVEKDALSRPTQKKLGSRPTIFGLNEDEAGEILKIVQRNGKKK